MHVLPSRGVWLSTEGNHTFSLSSFSRFHRRLKMASTQSAQCIFTTLRVVDTRPWKAKS